MKTMNYLLAFALIFALGSCSKETAVEDIDSETLAAVDFKGRWSKKQEKEKTQEVYELDIHQYYILNQLVKLEFEKKHLEELIDGGRKDLIPKLEITLKSIHFFEIDLKKLKALICHYLGTQADILAGRVALGDAAAKIELLAMDEALKNCGIVVSYTDYIYDKIDLPRIGKTKTVGGCSSPEYYQSCAIVLSEGIQTILTGRRLKSLIIRTDFGQIISKGKYLGESENFKGLYEYALEIPSVDGLRVAIDVVKKDAKYSMPVEILERR